MEVVVFGLAVGVAQVGDLGVVLTTGGDVCGVDGLDPALQFVGPWENDVAVAVEAALLWGLGVHCELVR